MGNIILYLCYVYCVLFILPSWRQWGEMESFNDWLCYPFCNVTWRFVVSTLEMEETIFCSFENTWCQCFAGGLSRPAGIFRQWKTGKPQGKHQPQQLRTDFRSLWIEALQSHIRRQDNRPGSTEVVLLGRRFGGSHGEMGRQIALGFVSARPRWLESTTLRTLNFLTLRIITMYLMQKQLMILADSVISLVFPGAVSAMMTTRYDGMKTELTISSQFCTAFEYECVLYRFVA